MPFQPSAALVAAFLGVLTAAIGTWIAWQQHLATKSKLRLDLYDRRYAVFVATNTLLSKIVSNAAFEVSDLHDFNRDTAQAVFLFDDSLVAYIDGLRDRALEFRLNRKQLEALGAAPAPDRTAIVEKDGVLLKSFLEEGPKCREQFRRYLGFETVL